MTRVGIVYDPIYLEHDTGAHVENADRLTNTVEILQTRDIFDKLVRITARPATVEEIALIHDKLYIAELEMWAKKGGGWLDADTMLSPRSFEVARYAAGGLLNATGQVLEGKLDSAFALVRPPGHHSRHNQAMGFCIFNNVAIAARYAVEKYKLKRLMIVDFDLHHGNGTQESFYSSPEVLYISTHQYPHYPGTGAVDETGEGAGKGTTINIPLPAGCGDEQYIRAFDEIIRPAAKRYRPELIIVSAGYDAHWADTLGMMQISVSGYARLTGILLDMARELCNGKIVLSLEGGYNLVALAESVRATYEVLLGNKKVEDPLGPPHQDYGSPDITSLLQTIKQVHGLP